MAEKSAEKMCRNLKKKHDRLDQGDQIFAIWAISKDFLIG
jgi:hypothetical protein